MKRFVLLLIVAAVFVCLLAVPAAGARSSANRQPYRPDTTAQYVWGPWWFEYSGATGTAADLSWWWNQTPPPDDPDPFYDEYYRPLSNDRPMLDYAITLGVGRGLLEHIPNILLFKLDVTGVAGPATGYSAHYGARQIKAHWSRPYVWDEFWMGFWDQMFGPGWVPGPFNPRIGAAIYGIHLQFPLFPLTTPEGDTAEPPSPGTYHVVVSVKQALPWNEMLYYGDPSLPTHAPSGSWGEAYWFDMDVAD